MKPSKKKDPDILTLDGHYSHSRNTEVIDYAREDGVQNVCLPPHSVHKLQPLGISFMQPLKTYHAHVLEILLWNQSNRGVTHYQITGLVGKAYLKSSTATDAANGFRKTFFFPWNRHIWRTWSWKNLSTILQVVCLKFLCHVAGLQKNSVPLAAQSLTSSHSAFLRKHYCF